MLQSEAQLQKDCITFFDLENREKWVRFSVPNEGKKKPQYASKQRAMGLLAGVADLVILTPQKAVFIEFKTLQGKQSQSQKLFENNVKAIGYDYYLINNFNDFRNLIRSLKAQEKRAA